MYEINNYIFDSENLLLFKNTINKSKMYEIINETQKLNKYDKIFNKLMKYDVHNMSADKLTVDNIGIVFTYDCNLRCTYCSFSSKDNNKYLLTLNDIEVFLNNVFIKKAIKKTISKKNEPLKISITGGGEPTFNWNFFESAVNLIKKMCNENNIQLLLIMTTNGILSDEKIDFIADNFNQVMVSYDGLPTTQNNNRVCPTIKDTNIIVENTIKRLIDRKKSLVIRSTIWDKDFDKIEEMYEHILQLTSGYDNYVWSLYPTLYQGRAASRMKNISNISYKVFFENYITLIERIIKEFGEIALSKIDVPLLTNELNSLFCGAYQLKNYWLLPSKKIVTCIENDEKQVIIGEISNNEVLFYKKYYDILLDVMQKKFVECKKCIAFNFCRGGCPVWHLRGDNKDYVSPECELQKIYWNYVIEAIISKKYSFGWKIEKYVDELNDVYKLVHI